MCIICRKTNDDKWNHRMKNQKKYVKICNFFGIDFKTRFASIRQKHNVTVSMCDCCFDKYEVKKGYHQCIDCGELNPIGWNNMIDAKKLLTEWKIFNPLCPAFVNDARIIDICDVCLETPMHMPRIKLNEQIEGIEIIDVSINHRTNESDNEIRTE